MIIETLGALLIVGLLAHLVISTKKKKVIRGGGEIPKSGWRIGPFGQSYGMPASPTMLTDGSGVWAVDIPDQTGSLNYVQGYNFPSLVGKQSITFRYRMEGGPVTAHEYPESGTVSLIMQRNGDTWRREGYRWWTGMFPLTPGVHEFTVPLTIEFWGDMLTTPNADAFAATIRDMWNLGVAFGSPGAPTHGVYGSGRFTLISITPN